jgi:hypothetical protein
MSHLSWISDSYKVDNGWFDRALHNTRQPRRCGTRLESPQKGPGDKSDSRNPHALIEPSPRHVVMRPCAYAASVFMLRRSIGSANVLVLVFAPQVAVSLR